MAGIGVAAWAYSDTQARPHEQYEGILWCDLPVADEYDRQAEDCFWLTASNVYWTGGYKQVYKSKVVELPSCSDKLGIHPAGRSNGDKLDYWKDCYYREDGYKGTREGYSYAALRTFLSEFRNEHGTFFSRCSSDIGGGTAHGIGNWLCSDQDGQTRLTLTEIFEHSMRHQPRAEP